MKIGDRAWVAESANENEVRFYGWGVYAQAARPDVHGPAGITRAGVAATIERMSIPAAEYRDLVNAAVAQGVLSNGEADAMVTRYAYEVDRPVGDRVDDLFANPRIDLDDGGTVWGATCFVGPESAFDAWVAGRRVVPVAPPKIGQTSGSV